MLYLLLFFHSFRITCLFPLSLVKSVSPSLCPFDPCLRHTLSRVLVYPCPFVSCIIGRVLFLTVGQYHIICMFRIRSNQHWRTSNCFLNLIICFLFFLCPLVFSIFLS